MDTFIRRNSQMKSFTVAPEIHDPGVPGISLRFAIHGIPWHTGILLVWNLIEWCARGSSKDCGFPAL